MSDVVRKAQEASARIARNVVEGRVASSRDAHSRRGSIQNPVAVGLDDNFRDDECGDEAYDSTDSDLIGTDCCTSYTSDTLETEGEGSDFDSGTRTWPTGTQDSSHMAGDRFDDTPYAPEAYNGDDIPPNPDRYHNEGIWPGQ